MINRWLNRLGPEGYLRALVAMFTVSFVITIWWVWCALDAGNYWHVAGVLALAAAMLVILLWRVRRP